MEEPGPESSEPQTAFISGPIEHPPGYFETYYKPAILKAITAGHCFVMGPAPGIDSTALRFLVEQGVSVDRITVYVTEFEGTMLKPGRLQWFLDLDGEVRVEGRSLITSERDAAMTRNSHYDILRYMTVEELKEFYKERYFPRVSATEKNERRRLGIPLHTNNAMADWEREHQNASQREALSPSTHSTKGMGQKISKSPTLESEPNKTPEEHTVEHRSGFKGRIKKLFTKR